MLETYYVISAVAIVIGFILLRFMILRWRNQAFFDFLRTGNNSPFNYGYNPPDDSNYRSMYHGLQLAPVPAAYHPAAHGVRAVDTDAYGRRIGPGGEGWGGKDVLPAYDNFDRPPKYLEAGWSQPGPPQPTEQSVVTPSVNGEQSGAAHLDPTPCYPQDNDAQSTNNTHVAGGGSPAPQHALPTS
ncbi:hypothetical protein JVU11DRAFT_8654 [Chiua virens]|nr:hypothetical protein JVU11DRAFT_8654 [Chiua virens]